MARWGRWVKLYVREEGSFAQLPLYVRALAAELLKICDANGRIALGGRKPWDAIAFQLGADAGDRRLLRKHIPILVADGYLELSGGDMLVRNFNTAQAGSDRASRGPALTPPVPQDDSAGSRDRREPDANSERVEHEPNANGERTEREPDAKDELRQHYPPDLLPLEESREEETREEKKRGRVPRASRRRPSIQLPSDWSPNESERARAREMNLAIEREVERFRNHANATDRRCANWDAAFRNWLLGSKTSAGSSPRSVPAQRRIFQVTGDEPYQDGEVEL